MYVYAFCKRIVDKHFLSGIIKSKLLTYVKNGGEIMPRRDGSGPKGFGPLTGRRMGNCTKGYGYGRKPTFNTMTKEDLLTEKEIILSRLKDIDELLDIK